MGVDIHMFVEYKPVFYEKDNTTGDYKPTRGLNWCCGELFRALNEYDPIYADEERNAIDERYDGFQRISGGCEDRNYAFFDLLAGCGRGRTQHRLPNHPFPADASEFVKSQAKLWGKDGYGYGCCTMKELVDWDAVNGIITRDEDDDYNIAKQGVKEVIQMLQERCNLLGLCWTCDFGDWRYQNALESVRIVYWFDC